MARERPVHDGQGKCLSVGRNTPAFASRNNDDRVSSVRAPWTSSGSAESLEQLACGSGHAINLLAEAFPHSRFVGFDFSEEGVATASAEAAGKNLTNARFEIRDVATLSEPASFDLVTTFDAVHDQAQPARVLKGIHDILRPGGTYLCVDVQASSHVGNNLDHPLGPFLYTVSCMHCMTVSLALGGDGLGAAWGEELALSMLREAGFEEIEVRTVEGDILNNYYIARRP